MKSNRFSQNLISCITWVVWMTLLMMGNRKLWNNNKHISSRVLANIFSDQIHRNIHLFSWFSAWNTEKYYGTTNNTIFASYQQMICLLSFWTNDCQLCLSLSTYVFSFSFRNNVLISINCLPNTFFHRIYQRHLFICIAYSFLLLIIK